ncbi:MAG: tetratricopeptide repeat protein [bacterium]
MVEKPGDPGGREPGLSRGDAVSLIGQLLAVGQNRRAQEMASSLVSRHPDDPNAQIVLSQVLVALGQLEGAQAAADGALRLSPDSSLVHFQRAAVLFHRGCFRDAEKAVLESLRLDPDDPGTHLLYARMLASCEKYPPALRAVLEATALDPDDPAVHRLRASILSHTAPGDCTVPEAAARRAVSLDPDDAGAHAVFGSVLLRAKRIREAEERFKAALELDPTNGLARSGLATCVMSRAPVYRPFLGYSLFMQRIGVGWQVAVIAGVWVLYTGVAAVLAASPALVPALPFVRYGYLGLCLYTWFASPVTQWILSRHYPWLRQADV